jgi:hypothetical protein
MAEPKIAVLLANLKMSLRDGIRAATDMQIQGVHLVTGCETGDDPVGDSSRAVQFLRHVL